MKKKRSILAKHFCLNGCFADRSAWHDAPVAKLETEDTAIIQWAKWRKQLLLVEVESEASTHASSQPNVGDATTK